MGLARLPESARTPQVARAITAPSSLLLAGAGTAITIVAGAPLVAAAAVGAACWAARVAFAARPRRRPGQAKVDARRLHDPWRSFVTDAQAARRRFEVACSRALPGPIRDHLTALGTRLDDGVQECFRIASQGDALEQAWNDLDVPAIKHDLAATLQEPTSPTRDRTEAALRSQLGSADRIQKVAFDARDRLRVLNAQMDEAVARAVELSVKTTDVAALDPLAQDVESLVGELESLRQALDETGGTPGAATSPAS